jgi:hypothetical protein
MLSLLPCAVIDASTLRLLNADGREHLIKL